MKTDKKSEVTPNYTIDEFGRIVIYKKSNKLVVQSVWPEDNQDRSEWI